MESEGRLIWIDLEMTGLDTARDSILEIATIVTDSNLQVLAEGPELAIAHSVSALEAMDEWNRTQHRRSGLWQRVLESGVSMEEELTNLMMFQKAYQASAQIISTVNSMLQTVVNLKN